MKPKTHLLLVFLALSTAALAQPPETFDLATFQPPKGWERKAGADGIQFSIEDKTNGGVCLITLFKSIPGVGGPKENFDAAWSTVVKDTVNVSSAPQMLPADNIGDWKVVGGLGQFEKSGEKGVVMLFTASGHGRMINALVLTNTQACESAVTSFLGSITLKKPSIENQLPTLVSSTEPRPPRKAGFMFTENRFNDGPDGRRGGFAPRPRSSLTIERYRASAETDGKTPTRKWSAFRSEV